MEDFKNILWLLVIAGSVIASFVSKSNKEKAKKSSLPEAFPMPATETLQTDQEADHASHEVPTRERAPRPIASGTTARKPRQNRDTAVFPYEREFVRPMGESESAPMPGSEALFTTPDEAFTDKLPQPITEAEAFASRTDENGEFTQDPTAPDRVAASTETDLLADFDLRKAVVWSEVLKPKYEEM